MSAAQTLITLLLLSTPIVAKEYDLTNRNDCMLSGYITVPSGGSITVNTKSSTGTQNINGCAIDFKTDNERDKLRISFETLDFDGCNVDLLLMTGGRIIKRYRCGTKPKTEDLNVNKITVKLQRTKLNRGGFTIRLSLSAYRDAGEVGGGNNNSGLSTEVIIGIVAGILGLIALIAIIVCCCYRKRSKHAEDSKAMLNTPTWNNKHGLNNSGMKNGTSPTHVEKSNNLTMDNELLASTKPDFSSDKLGYNANQLSILQDHNEGMSHFPNIHERSIDDAMQNRQPLLENLTTNPRFQEKYVPEDFEKDYDQHQIRRFNSDEYHDDDFSVPPPLPMAPKSPGINRCDNHANIRRAPRPTSSSDEIQQLEIPLDQQSDINIKLIPESPNERGSLGEVVPIRVDTGYPQTSSGFSEHRELIENIPDELSYDDDESDRKPREKPKHTLRPNRGKTERNKDKSKNVEPHSIDSYTKEQSKTTENRTTQNLRNNERNQEKPRFSNRREKEVYQSARSYDGKDRSKSSDGREPGKSKNKSHKSPRLGGSLTRRRGGSLGNELDDTRRPDSPGSIYSNAPLQRSGSRQSLYASRSSLYNRRRRGSYSESIATTTQDDTSLYRHGNRSSRRRYPDDDESYFQRGGPYRSSRSMGDVRSSRRTNTDYDTDTNFRRNRNNRSSRSYGDMCDTGTQTLYETATQTRSGYVSKNARRNSGRKSPKSKRNQSTSAVQTYKITPTKISVSTDKPRTVDSSVGPEVKGKNTGYTADDSDDSVTKTKRKLRTELNDVIKKPIPLKKPVAPSHVHGNYVPGLPTYDDAETDIVRNYSQYPMNRAEATTGGKSPYRIEEQIYDDVYDMTHNRKRPPHDRQGDKNPVLDQYQPTQHPYYQPDHRHPEEQVYQNIPQPQSTVGQHTSKPKSQWEILCDLTDSDYKSRSKASSLRSGVEGNIQPGYTKSEGSVADRTYTNTHNILSDSEVFIHPQNPPKSSWEQLMNLTSPHQGSQHNLEESNI